MASSATDDALEQFHKTYATTIAIRRLTSILRGESPDLSNLDAVASWKDSKHQNIEKKRLRDAEDAERDLNREKAVTRYPDRFLFAERTGRTKPLSPRRDQNPSNNSFLEPEDLFSTVGLPQGLQGEDDLDQEFLTTLRALTPQSAGSSKIRTLTFNQDGIPNKNGLHISEHDLRNYYDLYDSLPDSSWFRLLIIEPGDFNDVIVCQLATVQIAVASRKYETLSYSWRNGQYGIYGSIMCNGRLMPVTSNLQLALHHIRRHDRPRILWVDALCINQSNHAERAEQVQSMDSIYAQSFRTLVWLGQAYTSVAKTALNRVCELVDNWQGNHAATYRIADIPNNKTSIHKFAVSEGVDENASWTALQTLFNSDWFQRRWVIQEVVNSNTLEVLWGSASIPWAFIGIAAAILRTQNNNTVDKLMMFNVYNAYLMFRLRPQGSLKPLRPTFLQLLRLSGHFKTSETHDHFYALLGIQTTDNLPGVQPILQANYSLKRSDLCRQLTEKFLQSKRPLSFLSEVSYRDFRFMRGKRNNWYPSWVPTWTGRRPPLLSPWDLDNRFDSSKKFPFTRHFDFDIPESDLAVDGVVFSTIMWVGDLDPDWILNARYILQLLDTGAFGSPSADTLSAISCALRAGRDAYGSRESSGNSYLAHFAALLCNNAPEGSTLAVLEVARPLALNGDAEEFIQAADKVRTGRSIFVTLGGHVGLGPYTTRIGDVVAVLGGGDMPVVLGRTILACDRDPPFNRLDGFDFVGECFIQDVMVGEIVRAVEQGNPHKGRFDPVLFLEKLHDLSALADKSQKEYLSMKREIMIRATNTYRRLKVEVIDLI